MTEADRKAAEAAAVVFLHEQGQRQAATERTRKARAILQGLERRGEAGKAGYISLIRSIAERARRDERAHRFLSAALERANIPQECTEVFKACYLEGDRRPAPRELMRRFYTTITTVHRQNRKVLESLLVIFFGIDGLFLESTGKQDRAEAAGNVTPEKKGKAL